MEYVSIRQASPHEPGVACLLRQSQALMASLFPAEANHFLPHDALAAPKIRLFVAERDGNALGCAALADRGSYGEVKSMFVSTEARGAGIGARLLERLTEVAREGGLSLLKLETGTGLDAAHRLYRTAGFVVCGAFGGYDPDTPYSIYMERAV